MNFSQHFKAYEELVQSVDKIFNQVSNEFTAEVKCKKGCSDCCHAIFDITLIEALYLNYKFNEKYEGAERELILERANKADRAIHKLKKEAFKEQKKGVDDLDIIANMSMERVRCPLLDDSNKCSFYKYRPLNCRIYGIPTETGGASHICGRTGFIQGEKYPTIKIDKIYGYLYEISHDLTEKINTKFNRIGDMLMPVSMALLTTFNEDFLGIENKIQN